MREADALITLVALGSMKDVSSYLSKYPDNINAQNKCGNSIVLMAAKCDDLSMLEYLVENSANTMTTDILDCTPLDWAKHHKSDEMIEFIIFHHNQRKIKKAKN
jgi:ankyrin repeat protein